MSELSHRPSYEEDHDPAHPLTAGLRKLVQENDLHGAVLVTFYCDRVGVNSSGRTEVFGKEMRRLGDQILAAIDDGHFDPGEPEGQR